MALQKVKVLTNGAVASYHRVKRASLMDGYLSCIIDSYTSQEYREVEQEVNVLSYRFPITLEEEESMGIRALCYKKLKELEEWADATDC